MPGVPLPEREALRGIAERRRSGAPFDGAELARRIDELGDMPLSTASRHDAFAELYAAYTPSGFRLMPFPDDSAVYVGDHRVFVRAVIADDAERQLVGEIERDLILDRGVVRHELLKVQDAYRGRGVSLVLLGQALPIYRQLGLRAVALHAALETGRWHWARLGFDFATPIERAIALGWGALALAGLGREPIDPDAPARRLAQLGTGSPQDEASMVDVWGGVQAELARWRGDPDRRRAADELAQEWDRRALAESANRFTTFDPERIALLAARNGLDVSDRIALGKAIMLAGPDWEGVFDLADQASQNAFERELSRYFASRP
jgi:GNAT superfamily N-acetyltransferase